MTKNLKTLGKDLNQGVLTELAEEVFICSEEVLEDWENSTLEKIICEALYSTNDFYMDDAFDTEKLITINDLVVRLRTE